MVVLVVLPTTRSQNHRRQLPEVTRLQPVEVLQGRVQRSDRLLHLQPKRTQVRGLREPVLRQGGDLRKDRFPFFGWQIRCQSREVAN